MTETKVRTWLGTTAASEKIKQIERTFFASDEEMRYLDIEYREAQDDYLEFLAQTLSEGKHLPKNIIDEYKPYYRGTAKPWQEGLQGFWNEFKRFINI